MKFNKWTLGLAAIGAVSLTSAAHADEAQLSPLNTALSNTTISGYVDVGATYTPGNAYNGSDSFNNVVDVAIDKPLDESAWAAGYRLELNYGDSPVYSGPNYSGLRQAYVTVRTPLGNGINWKFGIQDNIIGYESNTGYLNPNYTRSYGYYLEPTTLVGLIGTYQITDNITVQGGIAENYTGSSYGSQANADSSKTLVGAIALTAPDSWGWLQGATLNMGAEANVYGGGANNYYVGLVLPTPIKALKVGAAFDCLSYAGYAPGNHYTEWDASLYASYQATDKLAFNLRGEYYGEDNNGNNGQEITATVQYNLWANVLSRVEFRWDHNEHGGGYTLSNNNNGFMLAANLVYQF